MTQLESARKSKISKEMSQVAKEEGVPIELILEGLSNGTIVIPKNIKHTTLTQPKGVGKGLFTKVNANIGTSSDKADLKYELKKLDVAIKAGADAVMDLSTGGDIDKIRSEIIKNSPIPVGTVPIYQAAVETAEGGRPIVKMSENEILEGIFKHIEDGLDFITIHAGVTLETIERLKNDKRLTQIVSRGGSFLACWMLYNKKQNPIYTNFSKILKKAKEYDVTLSLGDGLRPGCISDATDRPQIQELVILGELTKIAQDAGVQVMIEGPGHIPLDEIEMNVQIEKKLCKGAPFYVLGPVVTDVAPGYDHLVSAIGGAIASGAGADFLCYVTPAEHIRLPEIEDVRQGVIATRIAAHAGDIVKLKKAKNWDYAMSDARIRFDWKKQISLSIDPEKFSNMRKDSKPADQDVCTMCGKFCAMKQLKEYLK
ncbi:MAG: phosphomethylpyrimidine synthase ThiC [bacterium]|nr:phosphomethylpyrimidine synthase ThiC [bacterium]